VIPQGFYRRMRQFAGFESEAGHVQIGTGRGVPQSRSAASFFAIGRPSAIRC
jgi:hypothetical protein